MDGLENIIRKIEEDAETAAASVISDAEKKAAAIIAEAEVLGDAEARDIIASAENEREAMLKKAHSGGELMKKKTVLSRKVEIINTTIERAVGIFLREEPAKYFDAMIKLAEKYALDGKQDMVFSDKDIARLPADFSDKLKKAVGDRAQITVCGGGSFDGGFLLVSPEMVENCTVDALIGDADTEIRDELCRLLFV